MRVEKGSTPEDPASGGGIDAVDLGHATSLGAAPAATGGSPAGTDRVTSGDESPVVQETGGSSTPVRAQPLAEQAERSGEAEAARSPSMGPGGRPDGGETRQGSSSEEASSSESEEEDVFGLAERLSGLRVGPAVQPRTPPLLASRDLAGVAALLASGGARKVVVMCGAGISVSAGIPDFRTPGTGLYSRLEEYGLPHPQAVFEINFFRANPKAFYTLAKELWPGTFAPTPTHHLLRLLHDKGLLLRCYTQNIDSLESVAGLPPGVVIAAHGNFDSARCIKCRKEEEIARVKAAAAAGEPPRCQRGRCNGLIKPDIVFFGEALPERFHTMAPLDFSAADLLIVLGTSLVVQPFASLIDLVADNVPRLLMNRERVGELAPELRAMGYSRGFDFERSPRDVLFLGDCDDGAQQLASLLGWEEQLDALISAGKAAATARQTAGATSTLDASVEAAVAAAL